MFENLPDFKKVIPKRTGVLYKNACTWMINELMAGKVHDEV